jgi:hypothetical protein
VAGIYRLDENGWALHSPILGLHDIHGTAADNIYAVGSGGRAYRFDGANWNFINDTGNTNYLRAVFAAGDQDAFAVGNFGTAIHFAGDVATEMDSGAPANHFTDVWASGPDNVYASGNVGARRWNGTQWGSAGVGGAVNAVGGTGPDNVFMVRPPGDWGVVPTSIEHFNGQFWTRMATPAAVYSVASYDGQFLIGTTGDLYVEGDFNWLGQAPTTSPGLFHSAWMGDRGWGAVLVGTNQIRRFQRYWRPYEVIDSNAVLSAIAGAGRSRMYAVGDTGVYFRDSGTGSWSQVDTGQPGGGKAAWVDESGEVFVVGGDRILHYDTSSWTATPLAGEDFHAVHGAGPDDVYVSGADGAVYHFDGTDWTPMAVDTKTALLTIFTAGGKVFTGGLDFDIFVHDGASWTPTRYPGGGGIEAISGTSATDVYAVGAGTGVVHFDGVGWSPLRTRGDIAPNAVHAVDGAILFSGASAADILAMDDAVAP